MKKKSREFKDLIQNTRGLAATEYILILVVSLTLILTVATQVFKPLQFFLKDFMGTYVQCLLDTGELPALGGTTKIKDDSCTASWKKSRQAAGLSPESQNAGNSSNSGKNSTGGGSDDGGSRAGFYAGSQSRRSPFFNSSKRAGSADSARGDKKSVTIAVNNESDSDKFFSVKQSLGSRSSGNKERRNFSLADLGEDERKKIKVKEPKVPRIVASGENFSKVKHKFIVKPPPAKPFIEKDDEPFSIGNILRILFIVAVLVVLVLLVGGQALQLSKSWEK